MWAGLIPLIGPLQQVIVTFDFWYFGAHNMLLLQAYVFNCYF